MSGIAIAVLLLIAVPAMLFGVWQVLQAAMVRVDSGTVGLLIVRGVATERVLGPGLHFVMPYRKQMIQGYPLREMTYLTLAGGEAEPTDYADEPLHARLGDRAPALVSYTLRFRIRPDGLPTIHERVGLEGIKRLIRDESQRVVLTELSTKQYGIDDAFGELRDKLERAIALRMSEVVHLAGFEMVLFSLRELDLGSVGEVVDAALRAKAELELERAAAKVRTLRAKNDAANEQTLSSLTDNLLRYRQIELGREALQRWDGHSGVADTLPSRLVFPAAPPVLPVASIEPDVDAATEPGIGELS